jgi:hypothetical protein
VKDPRFGSQHGLLSERECIWLISLLARCPGAAVLEVGHYLGLSTCALVTGLRRAGGDWSLTTLDSHEPDGWVGPSDATVFLENLAHFGYLDARVTPVFARSQTLTAPLPYDVVFYDGDHGEEQDRFTTLVLASPRVDWFIFDDRDFPVPAACHQRMAEAGWLDLSPPLQRTAEDKGGLDTMTLGVWRR